MNTELLYQLFLIVLSIAGAVLIVVLFKVLEILDDIKRTTTIVRKRSVQIDTYFERFVDSAKNLRETVKGFLFSFDMLKMIKQKFDKR